MNQGEGPDPLLAALGAIERDDPGEDLRPWVEHLAGRGAAPTDPDGSEENVALAALFTAPIAEREVEALTDQVRAAWAPAVAPVVPLRRRPRVWSAVAGTLVLAAALLLWIRFDPRTDLPAYSVEVRSTSVSVDRAPATTGLAHRFRPDSMIDIVLAPESAVRESVALRVLARDAGGRERLLAPPVARSPEGAISLRGRLDVVLPLEVGIWRLDFVVTPEGAAPSDPAAAEGLPVAARLEIEVLPGS